MKKRIQQQWKRFLNLKIRDKILYSNLLIIVLMLVVLGISIYYFSGSLVLDSFKSNSSKLMEQLGINLNNQIEGLSDFVTSQHMNSEISRYLDYSRSGGSGMNQYNRNKYVKQYAYNLTSYWREISQVLLEDTKGRLYVSDSDEKLSGYTEAELKALVPYEGAVDARGKMVWSIHQGELIFASKVLYSKDDLKTIGVLTLGIDRSFFDDILEGMPENQGSGLAILNQDSKVILSTDPESSRFAEAVLKKEALARKTDQEIYYQFEKYIYSLNQAGESNLYIMNIVNQRKLTSSANRIFMPFVYASVLAMGLAVLLSGILSQTMSKNIKLLLQKIQSFSHGDFSNRIEPETRDEIGELSIEFNAMSEKMRGLLDDITREKLKNKNAEIKALQSEYDSLQAKINPHFLYNTLESINSMAKISGEEEIARAIQLLGNYLQDTVSRENRFVTLGEELQNALDYIQIQQIVHGGRLDYETDVDEVLLEAVVPKLILQPLIENAVVHGLEPKQGRGKIRIRIFCQGQDLLIQIADDGVGITSSKLKDGMIVASGKSTHHSHVGIQTVHKRIQILYGRNYGITVESKEKEGTTICIALPIQFEGEEDVQDYFGG